MRQTETTEKTAWPPRDRRAPARHTYLRHSGLFALIPGSIISSDDYTLARLRLTIHTADTAMSRENTIMPHWESVGIV